MLIFAHYPNTISALAKPAWGVMPNIQAGLNNNYRVAAVVALAGGTVSARITQATKAPNSASRVSAIVRVTEGVKLLGGIGVQYAIVTAEEIPDWDAGFIEAVKYISVAVGDKQALYRVDEGGVPDLIEGEEMPLLAAVAALVAEH